MFVMLLPGEEEITEQICLKIIERACVSNEGVDKRVLNSKSAKRPLDPDQQYLLEHIRTQLERDMYQLLLPETNKKVTGKVAAKEKAQAGSSHNWNTLFLGASAVADLMADKYGVSKSDVLTGEGKTSAAVRLALGETEIVEDAGGRGH